MADSLYFSLWFSDFSTESMFMRALAVMREFPFSQSRPGITALALHPVAWTEPTILEEQFAPGALPEEAAAIASGLVHEDYAYTFEANWDLWKPRQSPAEWILEPSIVKFIVRGEEFEEGEAKTRGDIEIDFGLDAPFPAATSPIRGAPSDSCGQRYFALRHQKARHVSSPETKAAR